MSNDTSHYILRPRMESTDIRWRGEGLTTKQRRALKKGLRTLHNLELMATTIYAFQLTRGESVLNRTLIGAMCNEASHHSDFAVKLREYGFRPFKLRWFWWLVGVFFGLGSRLLGTGMILKTGIWVETKAVHHYGELLEGVEWDAETEKILRKDREDEKIHVEHWKSLLAEIKK